MKRILILMTTLMIFSCGKNHEEGHSLVAAIDPVAKQLEIDMIGTIYATEELDYNITLKFGPDHRLTIEDPLAGSPGGNYYFYASTGTELKVWFVFDDTGESRDVDVFQVNPGRLSIQSEKTGLIYKKN